MSKYPTNDQYFKMGVQMLLSGQIVKFKLYDRGKKLVEFDSLHSLLKGESRASPPNPHNKQRCNNISVGERLVVDRRKGVKDVRGMGASKGSKHHTIKKGGDEKRA